MGFGLGPASTSAFNVKADKRSIAVMGDGGFWHNGLTSGVANAVFNRSDNLTIVVDNNYTSATGGQDILSSKAQNRTRSTGHAIERAVRGVGVEWVRTMRRTYDVAGMRDAIKEALTTKQKGPKVLIAQSECMLNKQRREKPLVRKAVAEGKRVVREKFGVDPERIPDYLALVGDAADGYPGIPGIGAVTAARLIGRHGPLEDFPPAVLGASRELALLFKDLATLRTGAPLFSDVEELRWRGPTDAFGGWSERFGDARLAERCRKAAP